MYKLLFITFTLTLHFFNKMPSFQLWNFSKYLVCIDWPDLFVFYTSFLEKIMSKSREYHPLLAIISCLSYVSVFNGKYKEVHVVLTKYFSFMPISGKIGSKLDQNWPLTSCHRRTSILRNKPPGRVWHPQVVLKSFSKTSKESFRAFFQMMLFRAQNGLFRSLAEGAELFFENFGSVTFEYSLSFNFM